MKRSYRGILLSTQQILDKFNDVFSGDNTAAEPEGYLFVIKMTSRLLSRDGESRGLSGDELMIFRQLLKDDGTKTIKSNIMSGAVQFFQATINAREWKQKGG